MAPLLLFVKPAICRKTVLSFSLLSCLLELVCETLQAPKISDKIDKAMIFPISVPTYSDD